MRSFLFVIQYVFNLVYYLLMLFYYLLVGKPDNVKAHSYETFAPLSVIILLRGSE